jgi:poly(A) polymerase Pap1
VARRGPYPVDVKEVLRIWSRVRNVVKLDLSQVKSAEELASAFETKNKGLANLIRRSDFFQKLKLFFRIPSISKKGKVYYKSYSRWSEAEKRFIKRNIRLPTKKLFAEFLKRFPDSPKTYSSIATMKSRIKRKEVKF